MKTRLLAFAFCLALAGVCLSGCAISHAPGGWLPSAEQVPTQAYGGWLSLTLQPLDTVVLSPKVGPVIDSAEAAHYHIFPGIEGLTSAVVRRSRDREFSVNILFRTPDGAAGDTIMPCEESSLYNIADTIGHFEEISAGTYHFGGKKAEFQYLPGTHTGVGDCKGGIQESLEGEFIAVDRNTVYVMKKSVQSVRKENIRDATLETQSTPWVNFALLTFFGTVSTLTHGYGMILSAPVWVVVGSVSTIGVSYMGRHSEYHPSAAWWTEVSSYARFPQGMPENLNIMELRGKQPGH